MHDYFNFALLNKDYFQSSEYLTSLFYNMTTPEEVNSDKDDDIDSFFTVQNLSATVSVLEQLINSYRQQPGWDVQSFCLFPQLKELFVRLNTPLPASLPANDYSVPQDKFSRQNATQFAM